MGSIKVDLHILVCFGFPSFGHIEWKFEVLAAVLKGILEILGKLCEGHELIYKVDESDEVEDMRELAKQLNSDSI